jgi:Family of unknown function (DUF5681)
MNAPEPPPKNAGGKFRKGVSCNPGGKKHAVAPAQSPDTQTEKARRNHDGLWKPGQSGNPAGKPKGTRHRATILAEELIDGSGELLVKKCVEMALGGDAAAMRLVMERLCPPRRERPVSLDMPSIKSASDLISAAAALTDAVAGGDITPGEAASLSTLVANTAKAVETFELAERLTRLEEQTAAKGGTP